MQIGFGIQGAQLEPIFTRRNAKILRSAARVRLRQHNRAIATCHRRVDSPNISDKHPGEVPDHEPRLQ
jgi:hypothetical protein